MKKVFFAGIFFVVSSLFFADGLGNIKNMSKYNQKKFFYPDMVYIKGGEFNIYVPCVDDRVGQYKQEKAYDMMVQIPNIAVSQNPIEGFQYAALTYELDEKLNHVLPDGTTEHLNFLENEKISFVKALAYCNRLSMLHNLTPCYTFEGSTNPNDWYTKEAGKYNLEDLISDSVTCDINANGYRLLTEAEYEYVLYGAESNPNKFIKNITQYFPNTDGQNPLGINLKQLLWNWYTEDISVYANSLTAPEFPDEKTPGKVVVIPTNLGFYTKYRNYIGHNENDNKTVEEFSICRTVTPKELEQGRKKEIETIKKLLPKMRNIEEKTITERNVEKHKTETISISSFTVTEDRISEKLYRAIKLERPNYDQKGMVNAGFLNLLSIKMGLKPVYSPDGKIDDTADGFRFLSFDEKNWLQKYENFPDDWYDDIYGKNREKEHYESMLAGGFFYSYWFVKNK